MDCSVFFKLLCFFLLLVGMSAAVVADDRRTYIIHVDKSAMPSPFPDHHSWYMSTLSSLSSPNGVLPTHLYTYNHVLDGFSAVLSQSQLDQLEKMPGHVATYPETFGKLQTTHSPKFLGLEPNVGLWPAANFGDDMIVGVIDTGIWPESESFRDDEMPPVLNSPHVKGKLSCEHTLVGQQGSRLPTMSKKEAAEVKHGGYPMALPPTPRCIKWNGDGEL